VTTRRNSDPRLEARRRDVGDARVAGPRPWSSRGGGGNTSATSWSRRMPAPPPTRRSIRPRTPWPDQPVDRRERFLDLAAQAEDRLFERRDRYRPRPFQRSRLHRHGARRAARLRRVRRRRNGRQAGGRPRAARLRAGKRRLSGRRGDQRLFDKNGNRKNRNAARLRFLWRQVGEAGFRKLYDAERTALATENPGSCDRPLLWGNQTPFCRSRKSS